MLIKRPPEFLSRRHHNTFRNETVNIPAWLYMKNSSGEGLSGKRLESYATTAENSVGFSYGAFRRCCKARGLAAFSHGR